MQDRDGFKPRIQRLEPGNDDRVTQMQARLKIPLRDTKAGRLGFLIAGIIDGLLKLIFFGSLYCAAGVITAILIFSEPISWWSFPVLSVVIGWPGVIAFGILGTALVFILAVAVTLLILFIAS